MAKIGIRLMAKFATSGNRTRASRVAGENSTTEPTLLAPTFCQTQIYPSLCFTYTLCNLNGDYRNNYGLR